LCKPKVRETYPEEERQGMKRVTLLALASLAGCATTPLSPPTLNNPLVGTWQLQSYADTPEGGAPIYAFGNPPRGLFVFTADGHVSINLMRNPPAIGSTSNDPDPDSCRPDWYCSYFGTYTYDATTSSWTTHVIGGNIPNYLGTDQRRIFTIAGSFLTISETYTADGKVFHGQRVLRRLGR
jgi:hypothetical protein